MYIDDIYEFNRYLGEIYFRTENASKWHQQDTIFVLKQFLF